MTRKWSTGGRAAQLLGVLLILCSVDYFPNLPNASLDSSWMNGISVALAQGAVPGRDLLFTYGPLAAMTTGYWGDGFFLGLVLSLAIALNLGALLKGSLGTNFLWVSGLIFLLSPNNEALFYLYVMVLPLAVARYMVAQPADAPGRVGGAALSCSVLLLPALTLAKLSFAPVSVVLLLLGAGYAACHGRWRTALLVPVAALSSLAMLWLLSGQRLENLPTYLFDGEIISGYTGAMEWDLGVSVAGINVQFVESMLLYALALLLLVSVFSLAFDTRARIYIVASVGAVLAVVIKAAVVRHGGVHSIFPWIVLVALSLYFLGQRRQDVRARFVLVVSLVASIAFSVIYSGDGSGLGKITSAAKNYAAQRHLDWIAKKRDTKFWQQYALDKPAMLLGSLPNPLVGLWERMDNAYSLGLAIVTSGRSVTQAVADAEAQINAACGITRTEGSSDVYPTDINCLTAKGIRWNPRPVFQSYSAYTPKLLQANSHHLEVASAPDYLYLAIKPIDERLPGLEDGYSWVCMAANYRPAGIDNEHYLILKKRATRSACPLMRQTSNQSGSLGSAIHVGCDKDRVFGSLDFSRNSAGKLSSLLYKQRRLFIDLKLCGGEVVSYRFVPSMASLPFVVSPLVDTGKGFEKLFFLGDHDAAMRVENFVIRYGDSESPIRGWNPTFEFKTYEPESSPADIHSPIR